MASTTVPCPKVALAATDVGSNSSQTSLQKQRISFPRVPSPNSFPLSSGSSFSGFQFPERKQSALIKMHAHVKEVAVDDNSNSAPVLDTNSKTPKSEETEESTESNIPDASAITAFMTQVSDLVKLVDSRDIVELELKQLDCEVVIRKKEALQHPAPAAPVATMPPPYPHAMFPTVPPAAPAPAPAPAPASPPSAAPVPALPSPAKTNTSSHPPFKSPMAGNFYRSPAPGAPPFVKVGDKVQKGQVLCIVEAMKLMNEIESDRSGTITEIVAEDGKPVSVDTKNHKGFEYVG